MVLLIKQCNYGTLSVPEVFLQSTFWGKENTGAVITGVFLLHREAEEKLHRSLLSRRS